MIEELIEFRFFDIGMVFLFFTLFLLFKLCCCLLCVVIEFNDFLFIEVKLFIRIYLIFLSVC